MIFSSMPWLTIIPTHVESKQCTCRDVISRAFHHAPAATQNRCGRFLFISITMHVQMHVHNGSKTFLLCSYKYVCITNKAACACSINMTIIKWTHWHSPIFYLSKFFQPWFVKIFHCQNFALYGKHHYYLVLAQNLSRKQIKIKLMLCKPIFIIHGRVKGFLKVILQYKNKAPPLQKKAWHMHHKIVATNAKLQVSVQILLYDRNK